MRDPGEIDAASGQDDRQGHPAGEILTRPRDRHRLRSAALMGLILGYGLTASIIHDVSTCSTIGG